MPRDCICTAHCQAKTEEEPQNKFRMPELFDALLDRNPRIALGIDSSSGSRLGQLFRRVSTQRCRGKHTYNATDNDDRDCTQRPSEVAIKAQKTYRHSLLVPYQNQLLSR